MSSILLIRILILFKIKPMDLKYYSKIKLKQTLKFQKYYQLQGVLSSTTSL